MSDEEVDDHFDDPPPKIISEEQWAEIERREGRPVLFLVRAEQRAWAGDSAVFCTSCARSGTISGDPRRGFCQQFRFAVSDANPKVCKHFEQRKGK